MTAPTSQIRDHISLPSAFALDLFGFDVYTFSRGAAGAMSFHDPLEGTEIRALQAQAK